MGFSQHIPDLREDAALNSASDWSFWDIIDLKAVNHTGIPDLVIQYNTSLPSRKGKLRSGEKETARVLIYLMATEMETLRTESYNDYLFYLSDKIDSIPVTTNRVQLSTLLDECYCKDSIGNHLTRLQDSELITRKINTSRVRQRHTDENGRVTFLQQTTKNGRGDVIYFINKSVLFFKTDIVNNLKNMENQGKMAKKSSTDNQRLRSSKKETLKQPLTELKKETLKRKENMGGKDAAKPQLIHSAIAEELKRNGDETGSAMPPELIGSSGRKISENKVPARTEVKITSFAKKSQDPASIKVVLGEKYQIDLPVGNLSAQKSDAAVEKEDQYREKINREQRFTSRLPSKDRDYFVMLLFEQIRRQVYSEYADDAIQMKEIQAKTMLHLHLLRLPDSLEENFQIISRAVQMAGDYLKKHPESYVYSILTWLRIDDEFQKGTLLHVIEKWVPEERERLARNVEGDRDFLAWQLATLRSEKLFWACAKELRKGFSPAVAAVRRSCLALREYYDELDLSQANRERINEKFMERLNPILAGTAKLGERARQPTIHELYKLKKRQYARQNNSKPDANPLA